MPSEEFGEPPFEKGPNQERIEVILAELEMVSTKLGLSRNQALTDLELQIAGNPEKSEDLMREWLSVAEAEVDGLPEDQKIKAQLAIIVRQAFLLKKEGRANEFNAAIDQSIDIAFQLGLDDIAKELSKF
jgi:hypothetical protein